MEQRIRTAWLVRQRFRVAANVASGVGAALALIVVLAARPGTSGAWLDPGFLTGAAGVLVIGSMAPRLVVQAIWRLVQWRNHEEWG